MNDEQVPPVKGIIKALHRGTVLTKRICKTAKDQPAAHMLDVSESAQSLERSLIRSEGSVRDAYATNLKALGRKFAAGIEGDQILTNRLQGLTISLLEHFEKLDEYFDDPMAFDVGTFPYLQRQSESCCDQTLKAFGTLYQNLLCSEPTGDDRAQLSSRRRASGGRSSFGQASLLAVSPPNGIRETRQINTAPPSNLNIPTGTSYGSFTGEIQNGTPNRVPPGAWPGDQNINSAEKGIVSSAVNERKEESTWRDPFIASLTQGLKLTPASSKSKPGEPEPDLIKQDEILRQMAINDEVLEKRRQSRMLFKEELKRLSSATSSPSIQPSIATSPVLTSPITFAGSASPTSGPNSSVLMARSQSRESQLATPGERMSYGSGRGPLDRKDSAKHSFSGSTRSRNDSEPFMFGPPSPQQAKDERNDGLSRNVHSFFSMKDPAAKNQAENSAPIPYSRDHKSSNVSLSRDTPGSLKSLGSSGSGTLPATAEDEQDVIGSLGRHKSLGLGRSLKVPGYGEGVEDGLEPVPKLSKDDPGIMLADEDKKISTPTVSIQSFDYQIKHDSSFYKYGGFCDGAKMVLRGVNGAMKQVKKPGGQFNQHVSVKCVSCEFEIGLHIYERDRTLDKKGIYAPPGISDILFRQQLLLKSHLASKLAEPTYACIFCIEDGHTLEDHDATVFFSAAQYFEHIQKHPRPLRKVQDLVVLYGPQPASVVDFDLCFLNNTPSKPTFTDLAAKLSDRPTAHALVNHRKGAKGFRERDPEGNLSLQFAIGAKIVGITFPPRFKGEWCCGYHDSSKAYFPASTVQINPPYKDNVSMDQKSGLVATAHWDHKRDVKSGWLSFRRGDRITHISYPSPEFWCWSGMIKGSWGLFPKDFVDGLVDTGMTSSPIGGPGFDPEMAFGSMTSNSSIMGMSAGDGGRKKSIFGFGGKSPDKEGGGGLGSRLGRSGTSSFSLRRHSTNASVGSANSGGKSPI